MAKKCLAERRFVRRGAISAWSRKAHRSSSKKSACGNCRESICRGHRAAMSRPRPSGRKVFGVDGGYALSKKRRWYAARTAQRAVHYLDDTLSINRLDVHKLTNAES